MTNLFCKLNRNLERVFSTNRHTIWCRKIECEEYGVSVAIYILGFGIHKTKFFRFNTSIPIHFLHNAFPIG